jgi:hypothetical protein
VTTPHELTAIDVDSLSPEEAARLLIEAVRVVEQLRLRVFTSVPAERPPEPESGDDDELLSPEAAAERLGVQVRWVYAHAREIPGTRRLSRRCLRISAKGLARYLSQRDLRC